MQPLLIELFEFNDPYITISLYLASRRAQFASLSEDDDNTFTIIGVVVGAFIIISIVIIAAVMYLR